MDKSVPRVTVWHHSAEPRDPKTMTLETDLSFRTSHSCQILIFQFKLPFSVFHFDLICRLRYFQTVLNEPRCEKTGLRGFRPSPTQTGLYNHRRRLEA